MIFKDLELSNQLQYAIDDLGFESPTPIQEQAFSVIRSGKDVVGIAQTGTGKTFAYMLPILRDLKFSKQKHPRVLVLVPTRELVLQVVDEIEKLAKYINVRVLGVYGGANINTQKQAILQGQDIIVATPGRLYDLEEAFKDEICVIHSNKTQNYRIRSIKQFDEGKNRILLATDVMARGLDFDEVSHVINFDTPDFPENYMHRIGRTGRAEKAGKTILFSTSKEQEAKEAIETLMDFKIPVLELPLDVEISKMLTEDERPREDANQSKNRTQLEYVPGPAFHEKSEKNSKTNQGGSYRREIAKKYKKPKTRGDKNYNKRNKK
ncbi:UNVERIFIED_CONTAM: hypothetical protein GTU68_001798 [Idotea baltica]|nr:hypothetical protein [Idotea baltica]